jgi:DNA-binding transcriptional LysR family regulator
MEWDDLKYFLAVARLGTLTKAGQTLRTTPATVARRIAQLESALGTRLFDKKYTGYLLTEGGRTLLAKAEEVEDSILSMEREALGRDARSSGKVRLTTTEDIATMVLAPRFDEFVRRFPEIQLEISSTREVLSLARGQADIAMRTVRPARGRLVIRQAGWWELGLYAAKSYVHSHNLRPPLSDLSEVDIITWTKEFAHFRGGPWFGEHARNCKVALAASSRRIHLAACKAGLGVAILPCLLAADDPDLICLLPPERVISTKLWLVVHRDLSRIPRVRSVMNFLAEIGPKRRRQDR